MAENRERSNSPEREADYAKLRKWFNDVVKKVLTEKAFHCIRTLRMIAQDEYPDWIKYRKERYPALTAADFKQLLQDEAEFVARIEAEAEKPEEDIFPYILDALSKAFDDLHILVEDGKGGGVFVKVPGKDECKD